MKPTYTKLTLAISSLLVSACGGSGGGGGTTPFLNLTADQISWVEPAKLDNNQVVENFCRYGNFRVKVNSKEGCSTYKNPNSYMKLFSASNFATTLFKEASAVFDSGPDECTVYYKAATPLLPLHEYIMTIASTPSGSPGLNKDSVRFITGNMLNQSCGTGQDFIATQVRVGQSGNASPRSLTIDNPNLVSFEDDNVNINWDNLSGIGSDFFDYLNTTLGGILGFNGTGTRPQMLVSFNDDIEDFSVRNGIALFRVPALGQGGVLGTSERIPLDSGCPSGLPYNDNSCVIFNGASKSQVIINLPGDLLANTQYLLIIGSSMVSAGGKNLHGSYGYGFNTGQ